MLSGSTNTTIYYGIAAGNKGDGLPDRSEKPGEEM